MKLTKKVFHQQVIDEANHLREHATDEEKGELDFGTLDSHEASSCIYGQMTGCCNSDRANELYTKVYTDIGSMFDFVTFSRWKHSDFSALNTRQEHGVTPVEVYIALKSAKTNQLIKYIKGEIDSFKP